MDKNLSNIKDRVLQIAENKGIKKESFFEEMSLSYGNFKGKAKDSALSTETIAIIFAKYPDINLQWLITGEGRMYLKDELNWLDELINKESGNIDYKFWRERATDMLKLLKKVQGGYAFSTYALSETIEEKNKLKQQVESMYSFEELDDSESNEEYLFNIDGTDVRMLTDRKVLITTPLITEGLAEIYIDGYHSLDFLAELPKHAVVFDKLQVGVYRSFEVIGDNMKSEGDFSIADGNIVTGYRYDRKLSARTFEFAANPSMRFVIVTKDKIKVTEIKQFDNKKNEFICKDVNPAFPDSYRFAITDIKELFVIIAVTQYIGEFTPPRIYRKGYEFDKD